MKKEYISYSELEKDCSLLKNLTNIKEDIKYLWRIGTYDGMLSGVCLYNNEPHYMECFVDYHLNGTTRRNHNRIFAVIKLDINQIERLKKAHSDFRNYVGCHTDYTEDNKRVEGITPDSALFCLTPEERIAKNKYYFDVLCKDEEYIKSIKVNFNDNEVVGWFNLDYLNKETILLQFLKDKIFDLVEEQKENKQSRKKDSNTYNYICYKQKLMIRSHLIAYAILRGKEYEKLEKKNHVPYCWYYYNWKTIESKVTTICNQYSTKEWSKEYVKSVLSRNKKENGVDHV